jgi:hypothetical protein
VLALVMQNWHGVESVNTLDALDEYRAAVSI